MDIPCQACGGTGIFNGSTCLQCGGDGLMEATGIHEIIHGYMIAAQTNLLSLIEKCDDIYDKCNDIKEKCDDIWTKLNE